MARTEGNADRQAPDAHVRAYRGRARRLRSAIREAGCDALLITNPRDIQYLTPFSGEDSCAIVTDRRVVIISDFRFEEDLVPAREVARVVIRRTPMPEALGSFLAGLGADTIGFQAEHMTVATRRGLGRRIGAKRLKPTTGLLGALRVIKDDLEVRQIRKAIRVQERALRAVLPGLRPGQREQEIAARLEAEMKAAGSLEPAFTSIVAARANGSKPHAVPGRTTTANGRPLLIDWGARVDGYVSDLTRTFSFGSWPRKLADVYRVVLEAQLAAIDAIAPGRTCAEIDGAARRIIAKAGYAKHFGHALGHGIGLDVHEAPRLGAEVRRTLEPGMVVTVEPGVYLPGVGGVRIEDDILVTERGGRVLSSLSKDLDWATL